MHEAHTIREPQHAVRHALWLVALELREHSPDQPLVLRGRVGPHLVTHHHRFHAFAPSTSALAGAARTTRPRNRKPIAAPASDNTAHVKSAAAKPSLNTRAFAYPPTRTITATVSATPSTPPS